MEHSRNSAGNHSSPEDGAGFIAMRTQERESQWENYEDLKKKDTFHAVSLSLARRDIQREEMCVLSCTCRMGAAG